ncbi:response regulator [Micrococcales bacterium 31B]|nr:response regulator [Micrococcales bacterium 31B]
MRVFIVDDDPDIADLHAHVVANLPGMQAVGRAHTGLAALTYLAEHQVDLILLDMFLPDLSGIELLQRLRAHSRFVDVVMLTASDDAATVRAAQALGVRDYLVKPFTPQDLQRRLLALQQRLATTVPRSARSLAQEQIDAALGLNEGDAGLRGGAAGRTSPPKGLSAPTLQRVEAFAQGAGRVFTAQEVADALGMSRVSARRYLEYLSEQGVLQVSPRYGVSGRPVLEYRALPEN